MKIIETTKNPNYLWQFDHLLPGLYRLCTYYKNWFLANLNKSNGSYIDFEVVKQTKSSTWIKIRFGVQDESREWQEIKIFKTSKFKPNKCDFVHSNEFNRCFEDEA